jgi:glycerol-3-phosphate dehydrogenase
VKISQAEIDYLCQAANRYFKREIAPADVVWTYSGVRPLLDDSAQNASAVTRDYLLEVARGAAATGAPLLNIWGGKITTYRKLAEEALGMLAPLLNNAAPAWTAHAPLPGGDLQQENQLVDSHDFDAFLARFQRDHAWLPPALARRYARAYGSRAARLLTGAAAMADLGAQLAPGLYEAEACYLIEVEWARSSDDILWRRSKLGLRCAPADVARLQQWLAVHLAQEVAA